MKISVIISYYKNIDNLSLILKALNKQSVSDFEVIISEDDNSEETFLFLEKNRSKYSFPIIHLHQDEDLGFRKNKMLNKSIKKSTGETLVFIDGDCLPHKHFVKAYIKSSEDNFMLKGRRVMLGEKITNKILKHKKIKHLNLISVLFSDSDKKKEAIYSPYYSLVITKKNKGLLGCNFGIKKKHLLEINGFDEDYVRAAVGEDTDLEWRLKGIGVKTKLVKNMAIVYHLFHRKGYSMEDVNFNREVLKNKISEKKYFCLNGLVLKKNQF